MLFSLSLQNSGWTGFNAILAFEQGCRQTKAESVIKFQITYSVTAKLNKGYSSKAVRHEREILNEGRWKLDFAEIDQCKPFLLGLSLAGNLSPTF
jgi:hypothetical protein